MLPYLNSGYDVYILDTFSREDTKLTYKVLLLDQVFSRHDDFVVMCNKDEVLQLLNNKNCNCHNCSKDSGGSIWLSACKLPQQYECDSGNVVMMPHPQTLWEFLWDAIVSDVKVLVADRQIPMTNLMFGMSSDEVYLVDGDNKPLLLWNSSKGSQVHYLEMVCDNAFYTRWHLQLDQTSTPDESGLLRAGIDLRNLQDLYEGVYSSCRFCNSELTYLTEKYLLTRVHLHGVELGNWFMKQLNGINATLYGFHKPRIRHSYGPIKFSIVADIPNAMKLSQRLAGDLNDAFNFFSSHPNLEACLSYFHLDLQNCSNSYYEEFFRGFLSQISEDPTVIRDHEFLNAEEMQKDVTALACRLFVYRLVMSRRINTAEQLYLTDGILRMEVTL